MALMGGRQSLSLALSLNLSLSMSICALGLAPAGRLRGRTSRVYHLRTAMRALSTQVSKEEGYFVKGFAKGSRDEKRRYRLEMEQMSGLPDTSKPFLVLGIESSCDDTAAAVVRSDGTILSNVVISQGKIHEAFGGVVPSLALEAHRANIDVAVDRALREAGLEHAGQVDAVAVTKGPGLEICLRVGLRKAQALAREHQLPFVAVHHLEAHCLVARLAGQTISHDPSTAPANEMIAVPKVQFPFLVLLASGGHTSLMVCRGLGQYDFIGGTLDDALGEGFDKAARLLGLQAAGSGGAAMEVLARSHDPSTSTFTHSMSVPMREKPNCDFSYAGLKSSFRQEVLRVRAELGLDVEATNAPSEQMVPMQASDTVTLPADVTAFLCHSYQDIAFQHLEDRLRRALVKLRASLGTDMTSLVVVGGVAANQTLRRRLLQVLEHHHQKQLRARMQSVPTRLVFPPPGLCTDNGVMVAWAGVEKLQQGISNSVEGQEAVARWPIGAPMNF